jgi:hypothetical protein
MTRKLHITETRDVMTLDDSLKTRTGVTFKAGNTRGNFVQGYPRSQLVRTTGTQSGLETPGQNPNVSTQPPGKKTGATSIYPDTSFMEVIPVTVSQDGITTTFPATTSELEAQAPMPESINMTLRAPTTNKCQLLLDLTM